MADEFNKKMIIVGEASVGKTSVLNRWLHGTFSFETAPTIGAGMSPLKISIDGETQIFHIWDTAGTPQFRSVVPMYCRQASIAIIVFDVTKKETFERVNDWITFVRENANPAFVLIGNKIDLADDREVSKDEGEQLAESIGCKYVEVSAYTKEGMSDLVQEITNIAKESNEFLPSNENRLNDSPSKCKC